MKLIILGKVPPPVGGVTIHIRRLLNHLNINNVKYLFIDLNNTKVIKCIHELYKTEIAHNHSNNRYFLFLFTILGKVLRFKSIITIHGNIDGKGRLKSLFQKLAIKYCNIPIVLNNRSYEIAKVYNDNTLMVTSFIPPAEDEINLDKIILKNIKKLVHKHDHVFSTNASSFAYDDQSNEIYGITNLIHIFSKNKNKNKALVISDPSGEYNEKYKDLNLSNILFITTPHSFSAILKVTDCFIRATSTDGDSLSIKESLYFNKTTISSDCVNRPNSVILYKTLDWDELEKIINGIDYYKTTLPPVESLDNGATQLIEIYSKLYESDKPV